MLKTVNFHLEAQIFFKILLFLLFWFRWSTEQQGGRKEEEFLGRMLEEVARKEEALTRLTLGRDQGHETNRQI